MRITNWDILRVLLQHALRYRWLALATIVGASVGTAFEATIPWFYRAFIDVLTVATPGPAAYGNAYDVLMVIFLLHIGAWAGWRLNGFVISQFQPRVMADLERSSFAYLLGHSYKFFTDAFAGSLVRKVHRISRAFEVITDEIQFRFVPITITLIGTTLGLGFRYPLLAAAFLLWANAILAMNYWASQWKLRIDIQRAAADSAVTAALSDAIANAITIKLFTGTTHEEERFGGTKETWRKLQTLAWRRGEIINSLQAALIVGIEFALLAWGLSRWALGLLTVGDLVLIQGYLVIVFSKLWDIGRSFRHMVEAFADGREMVEILELPYDVRDRRGAKELRVTRGAIGFHEVSFAFQQTRVVLDGFSLKIASREKVALVGPSGAGKSTITKLLFRFHDVADGTITIDGQDIARVSQESLRDSIALVPQEPVLFHRTLLENIRYGRREATDAEVMAAARQAHCDEFIRACPQGYETYVGERGIKLSGGERQRIAIARAILRDAPILVLDEATS
ncbi:ABC transporter ATP-binding protein, partial [Candidatus Uhrbacteria bacterium]|nr:ABC transporter ATP-binding protein [Candidatus Uhrbacteria bacterium]